MDDICKYDECTGCSSCLNVCPKRCITLKEDKYGELHPIINHEICIDCGLCKKTCPNNAHLDFNYPLKCYASWIKDREKRKLCASGGIGTILAEYVVSHKNGIVFGTAYNKELIPYTTYTDNINGIEKFKGSKYVQSYISEETFIKIRNLLHESRFVLYIGTPCQISGLKSFLKKDYPNLITVDLICHGVSPMSYLKAEIDDICKKKRIKKSDISNIRFRGNDSCRQSMIEKLLCKGGSNNFAFTLWKKLDGQEIRLFHQGKFENYYLAGFLLGITLRENCYSCKYARPERISDITIGDFIGLGKKEPFLYHNVGHVSSVLLNTNKGIAFYKSVIETIPDIENVERLYKERLEYAPSLLFPFKKHCLNYEFRRRYPYDGYSKAIRKAMWFVLLKNRLMEICKRYTSMGKFINERKWK